MSLGLYKEMLVFFLCMKVVCLWHVFCMSSRHKHWSFHLSLHDSLVMCLKFGREHCFFACWSYFFNTYVCMEWSEEGLEGLLSGS